MPGGLPEGAGAPPEPIRDPCPCDLAGVTFSRLRAARPVLKDLLCFIEGPGNHMDTDQFTDTAGRARPRFCGSFNRADVPTNEDSNIAVQQVLPADEDDIGGLDH